MARRVHELAKELDVKSTAIVAKCKAEGLDIKNHMSTLSAGLEATVREWFSTGEHVTTVELSEKVDLTKVKTKQKKQKTKKETNETIEETAVAVLEITEDRTEPTKRTKEKTITIKTAETKKTKPKRLSPKELATTTEIHTETTQVADAKIVAEKISETTEEAVVDQPDSQIIETPAKTVRFIEPQESSNAKPEPVPYTPTPAQMKGPRVIRVEKADYVPTPTPRTTRRNAPAVGQGLNNLKIDDVTQKEDAKGKQGKRRKRYGSTEDTTEQDVAGKKAKAKGSIRGRRSRGYEHTTDTTQHEWGNRDLQERQERLQQASALKLRGKERQFVREGGEQQTVTIAIGPQRIEKATIKEPITAKELSGTIGVRTGEIIGKLMTMGTMATVNQTIDIDAAIMIALEFGIELEVEKQTLLLELLQKEFDQETTDENLVLRPPVVAFLGHVDHGKTSLLDRIRKTSVVNGEAGGITQHIGSYLYDDGKRKVTFLDTPGHEAFTAMRARGADMTDIVVLVVAADDGVMPQTEEAINHAKAAGVPIVVALNKIDLPNADENRVFGQLAEKKLVPTTWGGDTEVVRTSANTGEGIDDLVEHLDYIAELNQLKAKQDGPATGWIIESEMTQKQGAVARLLIKSGTLNTGDVTVSGSAYGRMRTIIDAAGKEIKTAGPAMPVEISGLDEVPIAGDRFFVVNDITKAKNIADEQKIQQREMALGQRRQVTLENLFSEIAAGKLKELNVIIRADVQGSVDVLRKTVMQLNTEEVAVKILHSAVGGITEGDVLLAEASNAIIIGFQVRADERAKTLAENQKVEIRLYSIIYQISEDIRKALEGMLEPYIEEKQKGRIEVRNTFKISRIGVIAGCYVTEGIISRSAKCRLIRDNIVVRDGLTIESLKRIKDDVGEVRSGLECGIKMARYDDIEINDQIEAYELVSVSRTLGTKKN